MKYVRMFSDRVVVASGDQHGVFVMPESRGRANPRSVRRVRRRAHRRELKAWAARMRAAKIRCGVVSR